MLPLWPNQLLVSLSAEHVALHYRNGLTKKILAQRESAVNAGNEHTWKETLQVLDRLVSELAPPSNTRLHISLASDLVRYLVLPGSQQAVGHADRLGYAQAAFREVFGADSLGWAIQYDDAAPTKPTVCTAVDQALLDGLYALAEKKKLALTSIQPYVVKAINAFSVQLRKTSGLMVIVENSRLILTTFLQGTCVQLRTQPLTKDWQAQLPEILTRTVLLEEDIARNVAIYAPAYKTSTLHPIQDWQLKRLGFSSHHSAPQPAYAMLEVMA